MESGHITFEVGDAADRPSDGQTDHQRQALLGAEFEAGAPF